MVAEPVDRGLSSAGKCFVNSYFYPVRVAHEGQEDHKITTNASNNTHPGVQARTIGYFSHKLITFSSCFSFAFCNKSATNIYAFNDAENIQTKEFQLIP